MDKLNKMKIFVRVGELLSFTKTAETMNLPKATISTSIQDLESHLGIRLLQRTTRKVQLTSDGQNYLERCKDILADIEEMESVYKSQPNELSGKIRVDMAAAMATQTVIPLLPRFLEKYPKIEIELSGLDSTTDLIREGIDCAIRVGANSPPGTIEKVIGKVDVINCVSPDYIAKYGRPKKLEDLKKHKLVHYSQILGGKHWGFEYQEGEKYKEIKMQGDITCNNTDSYREAGLAGLGIIQAPKHGVIEYIKAGKLIEILPSFRPEQLIIKLVYPERRFMAPRVRAFIQWVDGELKKVLKISSKK